MKYQRSRIVTVGRTFRAVVAKVVRTERRITVMVDEVTSPSHFTASKGLVASENAGITVHPAAACGGGFPGMTPVSNEIDA